MVGDLHVEGTEGVSLVLVRLGSRVEGRKRRYDECKGWKMKRFFTYCVVVALGVQNE